MRDIATQFLIGLITGITITALVYPEVVGAWLKRVDDVRYIETMYE